MQALFSIFRQKPQWALDKIKGARETGVLELRLASLPSQADLTRVLEDAADLSDITTLDLHSNGLGVLPEWVSQLPDLTTLNLRGNLLSVLPEWVSQLRNLTTLDLSFNIFETLSESLAGLPNLTTLNLSANPFRAITESMARLQNLTNLNFSYNGLTTLPEPLVRLRNLTTLILSYNELSSLPESISQLQNLTVLDLRNNGLSSLPESLARLRNLTRLNLSDNQISTLPERIGQLQDLNELDLSHNQLSSLPESVAQLASLTTLNLGGNRLIRLPELIAPFARLTSLSLEGNQLNTLPETIGQLQTLGALDLSYNKLSSLPESIGQLQHLEKLDLRYNQLSLLPEAIGQLQTLGELDLSYNELSSLPEAIGQLQTLKKLDLSHNQLAALPESIGQLQNLNQLDSSNNPLTSPPIEVAIGGIEALRQYFRQLDQEEVAYLYEAKLLILGEGGAGKTTFAHKLLDSNYVLKEELSTQGVDVLKWSFPVEENRQFRVNIWDFGGQEIYHATHQFFLTKRSLYTLIADTRKEDTDFYYWLNVAELLSDSSPLLIIKNEKEDRPCEIDERHLMSQFSNLKNVLRTNLATNRGLEDVKDEIKYLIRRLHTGTRLPQTWLRVRERLEKDTRNTISIEEYLQICAANGISGTRDSLQLSSYLHDIGVFLHFQEDPLLRKTIILKPKWGTDAVYQVLDDPMVIGNLGRFTDANLESIWDEPEYEMMRGELLGLMMKFKLCYEIRNQKGVYIAPQLLTGNPPPYEWNGKDNLLLRYSYEFMPKGILTQFIVAMNPDILQHKIVWKSGVVIEQDRTRAEVIEYYGKREIRVRIAGPNGTDLMAIIRHQLKQIHDAYRQLHYDELVPCNCSTCKDDQEPHFYRFEQLQRFVEKGIANVQCAKSGELVDVRRLIKEGLNEENTNDVRKTMSLAMGTRPEKTKRNGLFISYSHQDRNWLAKVQPHIKVLEKMGVAVNLWDDTQIKPGMKWREEIEKALGSAKVAVLLVSTDFLNSDFISRDEVPALLKAAQENGATILPLILEPCLYTDYPTLKEYQAVNDPSRPLSELRKSKQEEIFVALSRRIIELMQSGD